MVNVVMIDCHDLGRHLGCYGQATVSSHNLDGLAQRGVQFTHSYCTAPQCSPSRASLYTGRYAHATGMLGLAHDPFNWSLHDDEVYLPRYLQQSGYETALIGCQHVAHNTEADTRRLGFDLVQLTRDSGEIVERVQHFLTQPRERHFYLNIGFNDVHRGADGLFRSSRPDDSIGVAVPPYLPATAEARGELAEFQGIIRRLDDAVGAILHALEAKGHLTDTWVIFATDHGIAMPRAKCTMYDPGIETAFLMLAEPFGLGGGRRVDDLISHVDLVPTLLEALGIPIPARLHGRSYWGLLAGKSGYIPRNTVFAEKTFHTAYEPQRAIRTRDYKLILNLEVDIINVPADIQHSPVYPQMLHALTVERPPVELYDLRADPLETDNLTDRDEYADIRRDLLDQLLIWMQTTDDPILNGPIPSPYNLRALQLLRGAHA